MRILRKYKDTRTNNEDFALTPYLSGTWVNGDIITVIGLSLTWGWASFFIGVGFNIPKEFEI